MEFKAFPKIEQFGKVFMQITQKIHGSNAQVFIYPDEQGVLQLICGSRTRWITPEDDNYGFARFVNDNKEEFIVCLGKGQHFGEWAGPGINSGEGLTQKTFVLFDFWKFPAERKLPPGTVVVPVLYQGKMDLDKVEETMQELQTNGSKLAPGFMRPEGIVINTMGIRYKKVFKAEETAWKQGDPIAKKVKQDESVKIQKLYGHLFQPIRLEKLISKDEKYVKDFPKSMSDLANDYFQDLVDESQVAATEVKEVRKIIGGEIFKFIKSQIEVING